MQHIEHDMDELFQKAAESYPLKTGETNWEAIASRFRDKAVVTNKPVKSKVNRKKYFFAALLLLVALLLTNIIVIYRNNGHTMAGSDESKKRLENREGNTLKEQQGKKSDFSISGTAGNKVIPKNSPAPANPRYSENHVSDNYLPETEIDMPLVDRNYHEKLLKTENVTIASLKKTSAESFMIKSSHISIRNMKKVNSIVKQRDEKGFYWGILAGPQFSEVKQQGMEKSGFDAGILAGYRINKNLAIESGLFYSAKYYYSDAQYFKMAPDPTMPANMVLMDLKGRSNVMEIPIKLRYDFINHRNNKFFATAGLSSYLLTRENNNYHAMVNGSEEYMKKSYKANSGYAAASVNISAGFEHGILRQNSIRIEPYLQIPIKGIGVGTMPVTSAGIHIGITTNKRKH